MSNEFYERQPYDTNKSYAAFCVYRDMGITRSLRAVGRELGKSRALIERWSKEHMWVARVEAFDAEEAAMRSKQMQQHRIEMAENHRKLARNIQAKLYSTLQNMDVKAQIPVTQWASILTASTTLERLTLGLSSENLDITKSREQAEGQPDFSKLTDEELNQYIRISERIFGE